MSLRPETWARLFLVVAALLGAILAPWWIPAICMVLLSLRFNAWEVPLIGLFVDLLWLPSTAHFMIPYFMIFGIAIVWLASPLRKQLLL